MGGGVPGVQKDGKISGLARPDVQSPEDVPLHFLWWSQAVNPWVLHKKQHKRQISGADPGQQSANFSTPGSGSGISFSRISVPGTNPHFWELGKNFLGLQIPYHYLNSWSITLKYISVAAQKIKWYEILWNLWPQKFFPPLFLLANTTSWYTVWYRN